jgi:myo-inositol 2-dehydrogenase / D-chiro-inositol 1-dehydrogenase
MRRDTLLGGRQGGQTMNSNQGITRRNFLGVSAAASIAIVKPASVAGAPENSRIRLGLLGCGRRGTWIGALFAEHGGYEITACADYFQDKVEALGAQFNVPANRRFSGLSGYKRLLDSGAAEAVAIETPPYFHPRHVADCVAAGLHVYVAKPVAVDVPGCHSIAESGKVATAKKLCLLVDFQARVDPFMAEAMAHMSEGAIGEIAFGEAIYHADDPFRKREGVAELEQNPGDPERRLRVWGLDRALSGDIVVEQGIHIIDMLGWAMGRPPIEAVATGCRKARKLGTSSDNFTGLIRYDGGVGVTFSHRQIQGHGTVPAGIRLRVFGCDGVLEATYAGETLIRGKNFFRGGRSDGLFKEGVQTNIRAFHDAVQSGRCENLTVPPSVQSNLLGILVRQAAYRGVAVRWEDLVKDAEVLDPKLGGLKE